MFKKLFKGIDAWLLILVIATVAIGLLAVASATASFDDPTRYLLIQGGAFLIGLIFVFVIPLFDIESLASYWKWIYGIVILLLVAVLVFGSGEASTGTSRWIKIGSFGFQPAEIVKILFIFAMAKIISNLSHDINYIKNVLLLLLLAIVPVVLIQLQPDAGTAIAFGFVFLVMMFIAGLNWRYFLYTIGGIAVLSPLIYFFVLRDYQRERILEIFNPGSNPLGSSYQLLQSKIAIGSGQIWGSGLFKGLQTQASLLPAKQTDFIFGVVGEEMGFIGSIVLVILLLAIIWRCFALSKRANSTFNQLICVGVGALLAFHVFENLLMVVGLAPITGIPLPFISYGGTNMLASMVAIGLVLAASRVHRRNGV